MKYLLSLFKIIYEFIGELIGAILIPFMLTFALASTLYLIIIMPLTFLLYLVGVENYEVLMQMSLSYYSLAFLFCYYCWGFYEIILNDLRHSFHRMIEDIKKLSRNDNTSEFD